jgi:hypothetical protein
MCRNNLHKVLVSLNNVGKQHIIHNKGLYPPVLNTSKHQTSNEMVGEINKFVNYLNKPEYSYLTKHSYSYNTYH